MNFTYLKRFPLYTFPIAWNESGYLKLYNNFTTCQFQLRSALLGPLPPYREIQN